ncbi:MAG: stage 0 sporulation family protein [Clostridia bacterium]
MPIIVGVKFGASSKLYSFDPTNIEFKENDKVIVETVRGLEIATIGQGNKEVSDAEIKAPLKPVVRKATKEDEKRAQENQEKKADAFALCQKKIEKHQLKMKLVDAEYTFDRSKVVFSFTADGRIDFRELVKDLASEMHMRIELRQIYERDDIKMRGAMGMCGRPCCCITHLSDNEKATVKMAKNQNIPLNPTKVSGMCGKLMCCLKYENEYYVRMAKEMPKVRSRVKTADGFGTVYDVDLLRARIKVGIETDEESKVAYYNQGEYEIVGQQRAQEEVEKDADSDELPTGDEQN